MKVLIVDDEPSHQLYLKKVCESLGFTVSAAQNGEEGMLYLKQPSGANFDLVLTDLYMPVLGGKQLVAELRALHPRMPVVVITSESAENVAAELRALGAQDFLTKPITKSRLKVSIDNAMQLSELRQEVERLSQREQSGFGLDQLIGAHSGLADAVGMARKYASSDMPVLLTGESGVGKEVFAHAIHGESKRGAQPFIAINCGAIPKDLVESTLFGHEKGAFTGAVERAIGKFREAEGGTLFLDEVGELPLETQVKLLRALQQSEVEPVGLGRSVSVNVRIISATNKSLQAAVEDGGFRSDLYFRLAVLLLELPALRARPEDITDLCTHFLARVSAREQLPLKTLDDKAASWAAHHHWPGNVRELENTISRAVLMSDGDVISRAELEPLALGKPPAGSTAALGAMKRAFDHEDGSAKTLEEVTLDLVRLRLQQVDHQAAEAAKLLGMAPSTFYRKLREWRDAGQLPEE